MARPGTLSRRPPLSSTFSSEWHADSCSIPSRRTSFKPRLRLRVKRASVAAEHGDESVSACLDDFPVFVVRRWQEIAGEFGQAGLDTGSDDTLFPLTVAVATGVLLEPQTALRRLRKFVWAAATGGSFPRSV